MAAPAAPAPVPSQKHLTNDYETPLTVENAEEEMIRVLNKLVHNIPPEKLSRDGPEPNGGLLMGPTGLAYLFLHLSKSHPSLKIGSKLAREWVPLYLGPPLAQTKVTPSDCGTFSGELAYCAVAAAFHETDEWVDRFLSHLPGLLEPGEGFDDFVYGRAGLLYLLRLIAHWYPASASRIKSWYPKVIDCILANGPPWIFHGGDYIGAGHGRVGIVTQILLSDASYAPKLEDTVSKLVDWQLPTGNWDAFAPDSGKSRDHLVQWCHGAPGMIQSLGIVRPYFPNLQEKIDAAISKGREISWQRGLIAKSPNLCHGITGNALAAFPPGPQRDHFLAHTTEAWMEKGERDGFWESADYDFPQSLFFASAGRAVGWMWKDRVDGVIMGYDDV